jgi:hypothetical protein
MINHIFGVSHEVLEIVNKNLSFLSPVDGDFLASSELVDNVGEMFDTFIKFFWNTLSGLDHHMESHHIGESCHR